MFKSLGESTPQQIVDFISAVTSDSAPCDRVISDRLILEAQSRTASLSLEQSTALLQKIADKVSVCGTPPPGNGTPTPDGNPNESGFAGNIKMLAIVGAVALGLLLLVKR